MIKHYNILVRGHVQGVGFRYSAMRAAELYNVFGFVRNEPDGSVYIEAEGETFNLDMYLDWCRKGPGYGRVEKVFHTASTVQGFQKFEIRI
ncbi:MAG: acylphosphatase [Bacteroidales bacterium]